MRHATAIDFVDEAGLVWALKKVWDPTMRTQIDDKPGPQADRSTDTISVSIQNRHLLGNTNASVVFPPSAQP